MFRMIRDWPGRIEVNGVSVDVSGFDPAAISGDVCIKLYPKEKTRSSVKISVPDDKIEYRITVKQYMTRPGSADFDFMIRWNHDVPMPLRTMTGTIERETKGMVYMKLHGQGEPVVRCMRCGRVLTNPVSKHYGIGPECLSKLGIVCDESEVDTIKRELIDITWEGWIIKSAITEKEIVNSESRS